MKAISSLLFILVLSSIACSGSSSQGVDRDAAVKAGAGEGGGAGTQGFAGNDGSDGGISVQGFHVTLEASRDTLCPGQCSKLSAEAKGGVAPYDIRWSNDLKPGTGLNEVCPTETTTYSVRANDSSVDTAEFGDKNSEVSASVKIIVTQDCDDAGMPIPKGDLEVSCSQSFKVTDKDHWITNNGWNNGQLADTDADGNLILVASFRGTLDLGKGPMTSTLDGDLLIAKFDPKCQLIWSRHYGTLGSHIWNGGVTFDSAGNAFVTANLQGSQDFGKGVVYSSLFNNSPVMLKLDRDGNTLWSKSFVSTSGYSGWSYGIDTDSHDNVVFSGYAPGDTSFGGGAFGMLNVQQRFIVKLDGAGSFLWQRAFSNHDTYGELVVDSHDAVVFTGDGYTALSLGNGVTLDAGEDWFHFVAKLDPDGKTSWGKILAQESSENITWWGGNGVGVDAEDFIYYDVFLATEVNADGQPVKSESTIGKLSPEGTAQWELQSEVLEDDYWWSSGLAVDADGNSISCSAFQGTATIAGTDYTSVGVSDIYFLQVDSDGKTRSVTQIGGKFEDWPLGFAFDSRGNFFSATVGTLSADSVGYELTLTRYTR